MYILYYYIIVLLLFSPNLHITRIFHKVQSGACLVLLVLIVIWHQAQIHTVQGDHTVPLKQYHQQPALSVSDLFAVALCSRHGK